MSQCLIEECKLDRGHALDELCRICHKPLPCPWGGIHPPPWGGACPYGAI